MDPWKERRLRLLYELQQREEGVLETAAMALEMYPEGPIFDYDKQALIKEGAIELVVIPEDLSSGQELYRVTSKGRALLREAGYDISN